MTERQSLNHIKDIVDEHINHIVREDEEIQGSVRLDRNADGTYDISIYKGTGKQATVIEQVSKEKVLNMLEEQL